MAFIVPNCFPLSFTTIQTPSSRPRFKSDPRQNFSSLLAPNPHCPLVSPIGRSNFSDKVSNRATSENTSSIETLEAEPERHPTPKPYNPSVWGNYFISYTPFDNEDVFVKEHQVLKDKVRSELLATTNQPSEHLKMIDAIERLGVGYHFNNEIEESLAKIYRDHNDFGDQDQHDLYYVSLRFRLLRQHGFYVASNSFKRFTNKQGDFLESLASGTMGILSLYEASHIRVYSEDIMEKALSFTTSHLRGIMSQVDNPFFDEVNHALSRPLQKSVGRLEARHHIISYASDPSRCVSLSKFAKDDFNIFQSYFKRELQELTRWWEELHYAEKFPLARDRLLECYLLITGYFGTLCEPKVSLGRIVIVKMIFILTVLDDLYDLYGTHEELKAMGEAIERWDRNYIEELPDSLKLYYETLLDVFEQVQKDLIEDGRPNHVPYALEEVKAYARSSYKAFLCHKQIDDVTYEEYLKHSAITVGLRCMAGLMMAPMGEKVHKGDFEWLYLFPNSLKAASIICRLQNDIEGYETDLKEGRVSNVTCYMKQYSVSKEEACRALNQRIEIEWVDINEDICRHPTTGIRRDILKISLAMAQTSHMFYDGEDGFRMVSKNMKDNIAHIFADPIIL